MMNEQINMCPGSGPQSRILLHISVWEIMLTAGVLGAIHGAMEKIWTCSIKYRRRKYMTSAAVIPRYVFHTG